jgi:hypothetical protein
VTLTVTDDDGASDTCSTAVTITDTTPPTASCPEDITVECDGSGNATELAGWLNSVSADDTCGGASLSDDYTGLSDGCGETGAATVSWTATDDCGLVDTCQSTFTIEDTVPPLLAVDTTPITVTDADCSGDEEVTLPTASGSDDCGAVTITDDAPAGFPAGQTTTVTYTAADECNNTASDTLDVTVAYGANIDIAAARHTVGSGSHPGSTKEPLVGIQVCAYDKADGSCARAECGGISHHYYECIAEGDGTAGPCPAVNCCTTDASGECTINLPPGDYIIISADATKTVLPDPLGVSASSLQCGVAMRKHLQQIVRLGGAKVPGKTSRQTGSELLIIEPEYILWDGTVQPYPFVFESVGDWGVTATVAPPDGFVADYDQLSEQVNNELEAVQFTITEVGSDLVPTETTFYLMHNGSPRVVHSNVDIQLTAEYARSRGFHVPTLRARGLIKERPENARGDPGGPPR